ncbi:MAG: T9SS type A sorting domain-containing protein [Bacteroidetes bacterium]|nr:T9SS type A sorting domain-containing protein [Bacteroidota bacterium]MBS1630412.1 T9SS type A sorting domain-containing protein [Bacteroidota bacterium]
MQFRQTKPRSLAGAAPKSAYGLSPGDAFTITDMQGKMVQRGVANDKGGFSMGDLAPGIYLLHAADANGQTTTLKFTK